MAEVRLHQVTKRFGDVVAVDDISWTFMEQSRPTLGPLQFGIILLAVATALIHFVVVWPPGLMFILNGLGYLTLAAALYLPLPQLAGQRSLIR